MAELPVSLAPGSGCALKRTAQQQATIPATTTGTGKGTGQLQPSPPGHGYRDGAHNKFQNPSGM